MELGEALETCAEKTDPTTGTHFTSAGLMPQEGSGPADACVASAAEERPLEFLPCDHVVVERRVIFGNWRNQRLRLPFLDQIFFFLKTQRMSATRKLRICGGACAQARLPSR